MHEQTWRPFARNAEFFVVRASPRRAYQTGVVFFLVFTVRPRHRQPRAAERSPTHTHAQHNYLRPTARGRVHHACLPRRGRASVCPSPSVRVLWVLCGLVVRRRFTGGMVARLRVRSVRPRRAFLFRASAGLYRRWYVLHPHIRYYALVRAVTNTSLVLSSDKQQRAAANVPHFSPRTRTQCTRGGGVFFFCIGYFVF